MLNSLETALERICRQIERRGDVPLLKRMEANVTGNEIKVTAILKDHPDDDQMEEIEVAFTEIFSEIWSSPYEFVTATKIEP